MDYCNTFFGRRPFTITASPNEGRKLWLHFTLTAITGGLQRMHERQPDGSVAVLGVPQAQWSGRMVSGSREVLQRALARHAESLKEAGATIGKMTRNTLVATYKNERITYTIK